MLRLMTRSMAKLRSQVLAKLILGYQHNGFFVDACVSTLAHDRAGLERLALPWSHL